MTARRVHSFTRGALSFEVTDSGPHDGEPVVLLHGFPQTAASWAPVAELLHERGYRTLAPNQRGYSPQARPRGRASYRMSALVGDITALVHALGGGPVHLVGHDWGAAVAWSTAVRQPSLVRTLTTVSVPHRGAFVRSLLSSDQALRSYYMGLFQLPAVPELVLRHRPQLLQRLLAETGMGEEQIRQVLEHLAGEGALTAALNWYRAMLLSNPAELTRKVTVPTTHVWGMGDTSLARRGADLAGRYVDAPYRLEVLDATHWIPEGRPQQLAAIIAERATGHDTPVTARTLPLSLKGRRHAR